MYNQYNPEKLLETHQHPSTKQSFGASLHAFNVAYLTEGRAIQRLRLQATSWLEIGHSRIKIWVCPG
jgi:hypothetical protein